MRPPTPRRSRGLALAAMAVVALVASIRMQAEPAPRGTVATRDERPALSPTEALASFVLEPGYRLDQVAAEPLVQDPVAIAFDEFGRLFVVENRGYPDPLEGQPAESPRGGVALLTDSDRDGRFDTRTEFATGLTYPNGIMVWDGGVFVTVAPDLLYLKDTDGDGVADERRVALTGFSATRTAQIRFSHPTLGPDGWIYFTSGLNGGRVTSPAHPERPPVVFSTSDSRYHPVTGAFELVGGQGQYGLTFDDEGRRFICANRHPVWQVMLEPGQLQRNPRLAFSDTVQEVSAVGAEAAVWPLTRDLTTASFHPTLITTPHAGTFTSASGVHIHRGDALPSGHAGSIFVAESAQNLVQRQVRRPSGVSFRSAPARDGVEFLASRDSWFRPVFLANGPDGALYVVDMYRKDIDHPAYVPEESRRHFDFTAGRGLGRIYRLAARDRGPAALAVDLATATNAQVLSALARPNAWWRETAQRLLVERRAVDVAPDLRLLASRGPGLARLHALWTLDALDVLQAPELRRALRDEVAAVRENAVRILERRMTATPSLVDDLLPLVDDRDARVRLHVAAALGVSADPRAVTALAALARRDGADRWVRAAIFSGLHDRTGPFLDAFQARTAGALAARPAARAAVMQDLGRLYGATESRARCLALLTAIADPREELSWQPAALAGLAQGLRTRSASAADTPVSAGTTAPRSPLMALVAGDAPEAQRGRERLATQLARAAALALMEEAPIDQRLPAIDLLGQADLATSGASLLQLLAPTRPAAVQVAAVRALSQLPEPAAAASVLERARWLAYTPRVRDAVLTALMSEERLTTALLDAVAREDVAPAAIGASRARRLMGHRTPAIRDRARTLLAGLDAGGGLPVYERARTDVLARSGEAARGRQQFEAQCVACHTFGGAGGRVGPDLSGIRNQPADALLLHILVPDYEITPGYESYTVQTRDGRTIVARMESETASSLSLRDAAGQAHVVLRADVVSVTAAPGSLMPATFHEALSGQDLADLLAYLKTSR
ncbi:PVC-type heme-binding CxxCH protein [Luteitalea sp.]